MKQRTENLTQLQEEIESWVSMDIFSPNSSPSKPSCVVQSRTRAKSISMHPWVARKNSMEGSFHHCLSTCTAERETPETAQQFGPHSCKIFAVTLLCFVPIPGLTSLLCGLCRKWWFGPTKSHAAYFLWKIEPDNIYNCVLQDAFIGNKNIFQTNVHGKPVIRTEHSSQLFDFLCTARGEISFWTRAKQNRGQHKIGPAWARVCPCVRVCMCARRDLCKFIIWHLVLV